MRSYGRGVLEPGNHRRPTAITAAADCGIGVAKGIGLALVGAGVLLGEDMVALGFNKNETSRVEESSQSSQSTDNVN